MKKFLIKICILVNILIYCYSICLAASYPSIGVPTKNTVNVRKSPSINSNKIGELRNKDKVTIVGETQDKQQRNWYEVELKNGRHGYVLQDYINMGEEVVSVKHSNDVIKTIPGLYKHPDTDIVWNIKKNGTCVLSATHMNKTYSAKGNWKYENGVIYINIKQDIKIPIELTQYSMHIPAQTWTAVILNEKSIKMGNVILSK